MHLFIHQVDITAKATLGPPPRLCTCGGIVVSPVVDQHSVEEDGSKVPGEALLLGEAGREGEGISCEAGVCQDCHGPRKKTTWNTTEVSKESRWMPQPMTCRCREVWVVRKMPPYLFIYLFNK